MPAPGESRYGLGGSRGSRRAPRPGSACRRYSSAESMYRGRGFPCRSASIFSRNRRSSTRRASFSVSVEDDATSGQHLGFAPLEAASGSGVVLTGCDLALRLDREDFVTAIASRASASRRIASISSISSSVKIDRMPVSFVIVASSDPDALRPSWGPPLPRVARDFSRGAVLRSGVDRTAFDLTRLLVREDLLAASVSRLPSSSQSVRINSRSSSEKAAPMPLRFMAIPFDASSLENAADPNYSAPGRRRD